MVFREGGGRRLSKATLPLCLAIVGGWLALDVYWRADGSSSGGAAMSDASARAASDHRARVRRIAVLVALVFVGTVDVVLVGWIIRRRRAAAAAVASRASYAVATHSPRRLKELLTAHPWLAKMHLRSGDTLLHEAVANSSDEIVKLLLSWGADVNAKGTGGLTPFHWAAQRGDGEIIGLLRASGADANARGDGGGTPLYHLALYGSHPDAVKRLVAAGADVNAREDRGRTALYWAVWMQKVDMATALLQNGADVNVKDDKGLTPLDLAVANRDNELAELLKHHGAKE